MDRDNDLCLDCDSTRWAHEEGRGLVYGTCSKFRGGNESDLLLLEPDFDFGEFRSYCAQNGITAGSVDFEFTLWLYSQQTLV